MWTAICVVPKLLVQKVLEFQLYNSCKSPENYSSQQQCTEGVQSSSTNGGIKQIASVVVPIQKLLWKMRKFNHILSPFFPNSLLWCKETKKKKEKKPTKLCHCPNTYVCVRCGGKMAGSHNSPSGWFWLEMIKVVK